jgi:hypothetical protein
MQGCLNGLRRYPLNLTWVIPAEGKEFHHILYGAYL